MSNKTTPLKILEDLIEIWKPLVGATRESINQKKLNVSINEILTVENVEFLIESGENDINTHIINAAINSSKMLSHKDVKVITSKLIKLAGNDHEQHHQIQTFLKESGKWDYLDKFIKISTFTIVVSLLTFLIYKFNAYEESTKSRQPNGELNERFIENNAAKTISEGQKIEMERNKLLTEGWKDEEVTNGQLPICYNFKPKKGNTENGLDIYVGSGTDVAIKLINLADDKCIRYVFINSKSKYKIEYIPEGLYYLKIAYGKEWLSKVENKQCIGKFISNPFYEKGEDILDFNLQKKEGKTLIPSYSLQLDIISSTSNNSFESKVISEEEFNK